VLSKLNETQQNFSAFEKIFENPCFFVLHKYTSSDKLLKSI